MIFLECFYPSVLMNRKADTTKGLGRSISYVGGYAAFTHRILNEKESRH